MIALAATAFAAFVAGALASSSGLLARIGTFIWYGVDLRSRQDKVWRRLDDENKGK